MNNLVDTIRQTEISQMEAKHHKDQEFLDRMFGNDMVLQFGENIR